jgi:SAM-dependent methyltransferase
MLLFNSPLSEQKADRLIGLLELPENARVLDVGCGRAEFLIRLVAKHGVLGIGVDRDADLIADARENARGRVRRGTCGFFESDIKAESFDDGSFDLALCIGATHAFGEGETAYPATLDALSRLVRPGGLLLVGEGYWKRTPDAGYLELIGEPAGVYRSHEDNVRLAVDAGLVPLYAAVSSDDEWDHFEWLHRMQVERQAASHPGEAEWQDKLLRSRQWRDGYLRWGRTTMGFGFYLFARPGG